MVTLAEGRSGCVAVLCGLRSALHPLAPPSHGNGHHLGPQDPLRPFSKIVLHSLLNAGRAHLLKGGVQRIGVCQSNWCLRLPRQSSRGMVGLITNCVSRGTEIGARGSWCINPELTRRLALATFGSLPWSGSEGKQASPLCLCSPKRWSIRCLPRSSPPSRGPGMTTNLVGLLRCTQAIPAPGSLFLSVVIRVVFTSDA